MVAVILTGTACAYDCWLCINYQHWQIEGISIHYMLPILVKILFIMKQTTVQFHNGTPS